jgi:hypothetical protein
MNGPKVSWYIIDRNDVLVPQEEYYAGSYRPGDYVEVSMQVWNNRWGTSDVQTAVGCKGILFFDTIEDSILLDLCKVKVDGVEKELVKMGAKSSFDLGKNLEGISNNGSPVQYVKQFSKVSLSFGPISNGMKNTLKSLYVDLQFESADGGE